MAKLGSIFLNLIQSLSPRKIQDLISHFQDLDIVLNASSKDLREVSSLRDKDIDEILRIRDSGYLEKELKEIEKEKVTVFDIFDKDYPSLLREISNPPLVFYLKGNKAILDNFLFAIVGSRNATNYGISMAHDFAYKLASLGLIITSGLARGIDTAAHQGALKAGRTIAVLGSGLSNIYPRENKVLAKKISEQGAIISEFSLSEQPLKENFPRRNRIISGLSKGVLVIEAATRSGALITARLACEQNREVFAIPGKADSPLSKGTHLLIKEGAKLVDSLEDILEELDIKIEA